MKNILMILTTIFLFNNAALAATDLANDGWTEVVATTLNYQSPHYQDILIHRPDTYSQVKIKFLNDGAWVDRFDVISFFLWGSAVPELQGRYAADEEHMAYFSSSKVKFVRLYARPQHAGSPLQVRVWMR